MDKFLIIRDNHKKDRYLNIYLKNSCVNNYLKKSFFQENCFNFFSSQNTFFVKHISLNFSLMRTTFLSSILNLKKCKELKRGLNKELMPVA